MIQPFLYEEFTQETWKPMTTKDWYVKVHSKFICNNQRVETNQLAINGKIDQ
jgi:hypothetical protein